MIKGKRMILEQGDEWTKPKRWRGRDPLGFAQGRLSTSGSFAIAKLLLRSG